MSNVVSINQQTEQKPTAKVGAQSISDIIAKLSQPIATRHLKTRMQGGTNITFIEWHTAVKYLDWQAPGWSYQVGNVTLLSELVTVVASISIPTADGIITREATGCESINAKGYGDAVSNAEAMALKRAAAKFGLGLYLYAK